MTSQHQPSTIISTSWENNKKVLILDVDNTLYDEVELRSKSGFGVEEQIIERTHEFGKKYYNLGKDECNEMYFKYGTTVEGLRQMLITRGESYVEIENAIKRYYNEVYENLDMSCLLLTSTEMIKNNSSTGYSHDKSSKERQELVDTLRAIKEPIYLASNSPRSHVMKVVKTLGLGTIYFAGILTPDSPRDDNIVTEFLPTKSNPSSFYHHLFEKFDTKEYDITLIDDSFKNLEKAATVGIKGIQVKGNEGRTLKEALSMYMGSCDSDVTKYNFSEVKYLQSKNEVDLVSINAEVWDCLARKLSTILHSSSSETIRIVDLGAGLLSMLQMIINGGGGKDSLIHQFSNLNNSIKEINYIAYESNRKLLDACLDRLHQMGFLQSTHSIEDDEYVFKKLHNGIDIIVKLRVQNFDSNSFPNDQNPHLVIGCCFADLFEPCYLATTLIKLLRQCTIGGGIDNSHVEPNETLVYFPITFAGITQFSPAKPFGIGKSPSSVKIPSDSLAFHQYARSLIEQHGHNLDPSKIVDSIASSKGTLIQRGSSIWNIDPDKNEYLWETMIHFFTSSTRATMGNWDFKGWIARARNERPKIRVVNEDLLFSLGEHDDEPVVDSISETKSEVIEEIMFHSPYSVSKNTKDKVFDDLKPGQVEGKIKNTSSPICLHDFNLLCHFFTNNTIIVKAICSLISSGTELKIFKGLFDDAALDVNIKGMADESMKYPLSYGYSLVGVVTRCAKDVADADEILGKTVFSFSPHSSHLIVDRDAIQLVPDEISPQDAIFMPSVETALSLVHDAHPRIGENVVIYGQGLIGLLVNSILSLSLQNMNPNGEFNTITAVDALDDRLALASKMGASQVILPSEVKAAGPFDVSIEVSGNTRALQSAIDNTSNGGKIIVGSWYGNSDITLRLGIDFHRSHKTIKTSQVSTIPGELSTLWSKKRRFDLTWELVKLIRPSRLITKQVTLDEAQSAYELLDQGKEIAISFVYNNR